MRLTFVMPSLAAGGGAERAVAWLAHGLAARGHVLSVITLSDTAQDAHALPDSVRRIALDVQTKSPTPFHGLWRNLQRSKQLRAALDETKPDAVISHINQTNVLTAFASRGAAWPVVAVEHSGTLLKSPGKVWRMLRRVAYPRVAQVVCVSQGAADYFDWLPASRKSVIYNPLIVPPETPLPVLPTTVHDGRQWIVAMGRLLHVKGFDLLLEAWANIAARHKDDWQLLMLGAGPLREALERQRDALQLQDSATFTGLLPEPWAVLRRAELFVMPSRAEGLPYALLEAMACGCPAVAFDCPDGPREIIRHNTDGLLVENGNVKALAQALDDLLSNAAYRARLARRAPEVLQRFGLEAAVASWEKLLQEISAADLSKRA